MQIDVKSDTSVYIEINGWIYYIDDSTNNQICLTWEKNDPTRQFKAKWENDKNE